MLIAHPKISIVGMLWLILTACSTKPYYPDYLPAVNNHTVIKAASSQLGVDYAYGGNSPEQGFDCSGLVYYSFLKAGVKLPRTAYGQYKRSRPVPKQHLKRGDLLFFRIYRSRVSHVGIYLGNKRFIHAPSTGKSVSIARLDSPYWEKRYLRAGRI